MISIACSKGWWLNSEDNFLSIALLSHGPWIQFDVWNKKWLATISNVKRPNDGHCSRSIYLSSIEVWGVSHTIRIFFLGALRNMRCKDKYVQAVNIIRQVVAHTRTRVQTTCSVRIHFFFSNFVIFGSSALAFSTDIYIILLVSEPSVERIDHFIYWSVSLFFFFCFLVFKKGVINNHRIEPQRNCASINDSSQTVRVSFDIVIEYRRCTHWIKTF